MALTKFLLLVFVLWLVFWRIRRFVRAVRLTLERSRAAVEARSPSASRPAIDLVSCSICGDSVPSSKTSRLGDRWVCADCVSVASTSSTDS